MFIYDNWNIKRESYDVLIRWFLSFSTSWFDMIESFKWSIKSIDANLANSTQINFNKWMQSVKRVSNPHSAKLRFKHYLIKNGDYRDIGMLIEPWAESWVDALKKWAEILYNVLSRTDDTDAEDKNQKTVNDKHTWCSVLWKDGLKQVITRF